MPTGDFDKPIYKAPTSYNCESCWEDKDYHKKWDKIKMNKERRYLPTLSEKIDRLVIDQLKEFLIPEHKEEYAKEIQDILHDIDMDIEENNIKFDARTIRAIILVAIMNREIWLNESSVRNGTKEPSNLLLTHALNAKRNKCKNIIQELVGGRIDHKIDNVEGYPEWDPSNI